MNFSESFIAEIAKEKGLTKRETEVFIALFLNEENRLEIAERLHMAESSVTSCLTGVYKKFGITESGPVKQRILQTYLKEQEVIRQERRLTSKNNRFLELPSLEEDVKFVNKARTYCGKKIHDQYSRVRLLNGDEVKVSQLYVDVWLLNRSLRKVYVSRAKLLENFDFNNDRIGLGKRVELLPGFDAANQHPNLFVLGKPGAGKTTFLKRLAIDWFEGKFQPDLIAVLIELRKIQDSKWHLIDAIDKAIGLNNWNYTGEPRKQIETIGNEINQLDTKIISLDRKYKNERKAESFLVPLKNQRKSLKKKLDFHEQQLHSLEKNVKSLLKEGKLLILMDGLDEVPTHKLRRNVQNQFRQLAEDYPNNRFILTCRTQIVESIPPNFSLVEVADFNSAQVAEFVRNWLSISTCSENEVERKQKIFSESINDNPSLKELTVTPVLLSLMCLVFQDEEKVPSDIIWLYKKGIRLLLSKWNDIKQIEEWEIGNEIYRKLSISEKEDLLLELAAFKLKDHKNFIIFEQDKIVAHISKILDLPNKSDGVPVLKAIEAQHGLLIERADELWSFSHLTFQEYFAVQWLTKLSSTKLTEKMSDPHWQKVAEHLMKSKQYSQYLLDLYKQAADKSVREDIQIQELLKNIFQKSKSIQEELNSNKNYKLSAIRAFYFSLSLSIDSGLTFIIDRDLSFSVSKDQENALALDCALTDAISVASEHDIGNYIDVILSRAVNHAKGDTNISTECSSKLEFLRLQLKFSVGTRLEEREKWWSSKESREWLRQLRQAAITYRNIGHRFQFTEEQIQNLKNYYSTNKLIFRLMNSNKIEASIRITMEETALLPFEELQKIVV